MGFELFEFLWVLIYLDFYIFSSEWLVADERAFIKEVCFAVAVQSVVPSRSTASTERSFFAFHVAEPATLAFGHAARAR